MKIISFAVCGMALYLLLCGAAFAAPTGAIISGEKAAEAEALMQYLTGAVEGEGKKTVLVSCGVRCPRCGVFDKLITEFMPEEVRKQYQFRWTFFPDEEYPGLFFPMENIPGAGIKQLYAEGKPRDLQNPDLIKAITAKNDMIYVRIASLFPSRGGVTPNIYIKTPEGIRRFTLEDFREATPGEILSDAMHIPQKDMPSIIRDEEAFTPLPPGKHVYASKRTMIRMFPTEDAPVFQALDKHRGGPASGENDEWISMPLQSGGAMFIKKSDSFLQ